MDPQRLVLPGGSEQVPCVNGDAAAVVVICRGSEEDQHTTTWSEVLPIPMKRPFAGGRNGEWSVLKDPHDVLTNGAKPRRAYLEATLRMALA